MTRAEEAMLDRIRRSGGGLYWGDLSPQRATYRTLVSLAAAGLIELSSKDSCAEGRLLVSARMVAGSLRLVVDRPSEGV